MISDTESDWIPTGTYETKAQNNVFGTLTTQETTGTSLSMIYDLLAGEYTTEEVGTYGTKAAIDKYGTVKSTQTLGTSQRKIKTDNLVDYPEGWMWLSSGSYTTDATNDIYGTLAVQTTDGISTAMVFDLLTGKYTSEEVGSYETNATDIDE